MDDAACTLIRFSLNFRNDLQFRNDTDSPENGLLVVLAVDYLETVSFRIAMLQ